MDPLTLSINTVRGEAMHAVIQYATWRKLAQEELDLGSLPDVARNLEAHLDPSRDRSETSIGLTRNGSPTACPFCFPRIVSRCAWRPGRRSSHG
jgi:hypothetical protein